MKQTVLRILFLCATLSLLLIGCTITRNPAEPTTLTQQTTVTQATTSTQVTTSTQATTPTQTTAPTETTPLTQATTPTETVAPTQPTTPTQVTNPTANPDDPLLQQYAINAARLDGVKTVAIDPGHQRKGNYTKEPIAPGETRCKAKVASGATGVSTGVDEYVLNLEVSLMLRQELLSRGYQVVMVRTSHDVDISNASRAIFCNNSGADIAIRIHGNSVDNPSVHGALTISTTDENPWVGAVTQESQKLSRLVVDHFCQVTGAKNRGVMLSDEYTGSNWSKIPVTILEMGFLSCPMEDEKMATDAYRQLMVQGIANGIDAYFQQMSDY